MRRGIITLLTDFGLEDSYVGTMKGVILGINPAAVLVDLTHQIEPGNIEAAARALLETGPFFPRGSIHLAVVDPGVGTNRRAITVKSGDHLFVGPDNGIFWPVMQRDPKAMVFGLTEATFFLSRVSNTFHGRDIFAPVAAHLSMGTNPSDMGPEITDPVSLKKSVPAVSEGRLKGRIVGADHFGNLMTNISRKRLAHFLKRRKPLIQVGNQEIEKFVKTYGEVEKGTLVALFGSSGYLEISVSGGRADLLLNPDGSKTLDVRVDRASP